MISLSTIYRRSVSIKAMACKAGIQQETSGEFYLKKEVIIATIFKDLHFELNV